nr:MAG TPA: hypothetical protein [Caudoviricetes sp.]
MDSLSSFKPHVCVSTPSGSAGHASGMFFVGESFYCLFSRIVSRPPPGAGMSPLFSYSISSLR